VSFVCDACQDVVKKPKLDEHKARCRGASFTCVDCNSHFEGTSYRSHTSCVSEKVKYQANYQSKNTEPQALLVSEQPQEPNNEEIPEKNKKQKRRRSDDDLYKNRKRQKHSEAGLNHVIDLDNFPWKDTIAKELRKAANNEFPAKMVKRTVVKTFLKDVRKQFDSYFELQIQDKTHFIVSGTQLKLKS